MALNYDSKENEIVHCRTYSLAAEAEIACSILKQEGIPCFVENDIFASVYPMPYGSPFGGARVMVHGRDLEKALDILNSINLESL